VRAHRALDLPDEEQSPYVVARSILRDARNHVRAISESKADAPFFLHRTDPIFYRTVALADDPQDWRLNNIRSPFAGRADDVTAQLLEVMGHLSAIGGPGRIHRFITSPGHEELTDWIGNICAELKQTDAQRVEGIVVRHLQEQLRRGSFDRPVQNLLRHPRTTLLKLVELMLCGIALLVHKADPLSVLHTGVAVIGARDELRAQYRGPKWPFLYVYGDAATQDRVKHIAYALERLKGA
jgi:hypothetical protein